MGTAIVIFLIVAAIAGTVWSLALYVGDEADIAPQARLDPLGKLKSPPAQKDSNKEH